MNLCEDKLIAHFSVQAMAQNSIRGRAFGAKLAASDTRKWHGANFLMACLGGAMVEKLFV